MRVQAVKMNMLKNKCVIISDQETIGKIWYHFPLFYILFLSIYSTFVTRERQRNSR